MPNRLIDEKSPYLLQHAHNPVDWYPWGDEAFAAARRGNKPVFLSVGYATCHWCHVMEKESFEDPEAAEALNRHFVCIKVDREERPDIDAVYMTACQLVTGSGGWPLTIVMTPDKEPFFAGTYLPKTSRLGRMGLMDLCTRISEVWQGSPDRVVESAREMVNHVKGAFEFDAHGDADPQSGVLDQACADISQRYDTRHGGFDSAPKFPMAHRLLFLMRVYERTHNAGLLDMVVHTLTAMRLGGLWDHVGFGFHRYATDGHWLLPHFEKMLYDQAFLALAYLKAYQITGNSLFGQTAREIFTYVLRDMTDPQGGFYAAEDADSEGEEGKCYLWSQQEFEQIVGADAKGPPWVSILNLQPEGNFLEEATRKKTGTNILHLTKSWDQWSQDLDLAPGKLADQWHDLRQRLFAVRLKRVPPLKDDKILTDWNGMMIATLAVGARVLEDNTYKAPAEKAAVFIFDRMRNTRGLLHRFRDGQAAYPATANDYAFLGMGLIELHRATGDASWLTRAAELQQKMDADFWDGDQGGYFLTAIDQKDLPARPKEIYDGALPSANSVALNNLVLMGRLTGDGQYVTRARELMQAFGGSVRRQPMAFTHTLNGWDLTMNENES